MVDLAVLTAVVFAFGLVSRRLEGSVLTAPMVFVIAGAILGPAAEAPLLAGREEIEQVVALTVLFSVLMHGITAAPLSAAYARLVEGMAADAPEKQAAAEVPTRVGSVPTSDS